MVRQVSKMGLSLRTLVLEEVSSESEAPTMEMGCEICHLHDVFLMSGHDPSQYPVLIIHRILHMQAVHQGLVLAGVGLGPAVGGPVQGPVGGGGLGQGHGGGGGQGAVGGVVQPLYYYLFDNLDFFQ